MSALARLGRLARVAVVVALVATAWRAEAQQARLPDSPAGKVLDAWLTAFNTGVPATILAFDAAYRAPMSIDQTMFLRATTGGFTLIRVERSEPRSITALVQDKFSEQLEQVDVSVDEGTPAKIVKHEVRPVPRPADLAIPRLSEAGAVAALVERAGNAAAGDEFSGVLLVARGDRILLEKAWGYATRESRAPVTLDTGFEIASTAKMFTAVAALQLVEAGKLRLDDAVARHIPDYENKDFASKVTVRHLLMHTGGTGGLPRADVRKTLRTHADYVRVLGPRPPLFEPGTEYQYSNYGYILLGAIVERASGMSYDDYLRRRVFEPAGMRFTTVGFSSQPTPNRAPGYSRQNGQWTRASSDDPSASGEPFSTAGDLLRFARALDSGKLISKATLAEATTPPPGRRYGYGFVMMEHGTIRSYGHGGSGAGVSSDVRIVPQLGYVVIGVSNFETPAAGRLVDFFLNRMPAR